MLPTVENPPRRVREVLAISWRVSTRLMNLRRSLAWFRVCGLGFGVFGVFCVWGGSTNLRLSLVLCDREGKWHSTHDVARLWSVSGNGSEKEEERMKEGETVSE